MGEGYSGDDFGRKVVESNWVTSSDSNDALTGAVGASMRVVRDVRRFVVSWSWSKSVFVAVLGISVLVGLTHGWFVILVFTQWNNYRAMRAQDRYYRDIIPNRLLTEDAFRQYPSQKSLYNSMHASIHIVRVEESAVHVRLIVRNEGATTDDPVHYTIHNQLLSPYHVMYDPPDSSYYMVDDSADTASVTIGTKAKLGPGMHDFGLITFTVSHPLATTAGLSELFTIDRSSAHR